MKRKTYTVQSHKCICTNQCVTIIDSYNVKNIDEFLSELKITIGKDFHYKRSLSSWSKEWYVHNLLYKKGLFISHTKDVDLDEDESKFRLLCYQAFGLEQRNIYHKNIH